MTQGQLEGQAYVYRRVGREEPLCLTCHHLSPYASQSHVCRDRQQSSPTGIQAEYSQLLDRNLVESALTKSLDFASLDELDPSLGGVSGRLFWLP